ncbi:MAG: ATP-dependent zinc metalloprotease FtsH [Planctomycetota bacterium]
MSANLSPENEKNRRSKSFGSFFLVLVVLLVILMLVGSERMSGPEKLSQDRYEYYLHTGKVVRQEFLGTEQGTNVIRGTYLKPGDGETPFEVMYADLADREELFRELKSIRAESYSPIASSRLVEEIADGDLVPLSARHLVAFTDPTDPKQQAAAKQAAKDAKDSDTASPVATVGPSTGRIKTTEKLLVRALVANPSVLTEIPSLARSGSNVYLDVQLRDETDLAHTVAALTTLGVPTQRATFDISDPAVGGTSWKDSTSPFAWAFFYLGPFLLVFLLFVFLMRQMRNQGGAGGVMSFGRSRAQLYTKENHTNVTFDDVAGVTEAKEEVREIVEFLKNPTRFTRIGGRIPRGVLLVGAPGCGKTLLAKAIAGEAEVPFFSISGSDFVEMFVGVGASRVRDLFKQARENSPCIIFLDEIDAVGRRRGSGMGGGHDEREQTLNAILVEMDGFGTDEGIIVVAATNRRDVLDPALLRPGRFDREVVIDLPDYVGRKAILEVHLKRVKYDPSIDTAVLARSTPGYSGADLAAIVNEAAIMAVLAKREEVHMEDLEEAREKVRYGRQKKSYKVEEEDRAITAYHEAGHAVIAHVLPETDPPHKVTIIPRGMALGTTMMLPTKESHHTQRKKLIGQLAVMFGGRAAEEIFCGDISAGAYDDIRRATDLVRSMVTELGMSEAIGPINYGERQGSEFLGTELMRGKLHSEETAREIDQEVRRVMTEAYDRAIEVLRENRAGMENVAAALMKYETIDGREISDLLDGKAVDTLRPEKQITAAASASPAKHARERENKGELGGNPGFSPA